jgi:hypothetical protein
VFLSCSVDILHDKLAGKSASSMNDKIILLHCALKFVQKSYTEHRTLWLWDVDQNIESKKVSKSALDPDPDSMRYLDPYPDPDPGGFIFKVQ